MLGLNLQESEVALVTKQPPTDTTHTTTVRFRSLHGVDQSSSLAEKETSDMASAPNDNAQLATQEDGVAAQVVASNETVSNETVESDIPVEQGGTPADKKGPAPSSVTSSRQGIMRLVLA